MSLGPFNLTSRLHSASLEVDDLARRGRLLVERVGRLEQDQQNAMPIFSGPSTKVAIQVHLERLEEWIRTPTRARNRARFQNEGFDFQVIHSAILDDSEATDSIVSLINKIILEVPFLSGELLSDTCLKHWIKQGFDEVSDKLEAIYSAANGFKRLDKAGLCDQHQNLLVAAAIREPEQIRSLENLATKVALLSGIGIQVSTSGNLIEQADQLAACAECVEQIKNQFPEYLNSICSAVINKGVAAAHSFMKDKLDGYWEEHDLLVSEWNRLHETVNLLGIENEYVDPPHSLVGIRQQISDFRQQCSEKIGLEGMAMLSFLKGESTFPEMSDIAAVEKALISLRPFIALQHGDNDA